MSGVLDQIMLEEIAKYCPEKFLGYHKCMTANRSEPGKCLEIQQDLSKCIKTEVPAFQKIQTDCLDKLKGYENCLRTNAGKQATTKCFEHLQGLRKCASGAIDLKEE